MRIIKFFHKLFRPNCDCSVCIAPRCEMCEVYRTLLEHERVDRHKLIQVLTTPTIVGEEPKLNIFHKPIGGTRPWELKRRELEANDRAKAEQMRTQKEERIQATKLEKVVIDDSINKLEKELGVNSEYTD